MSEIHSTSSKGRIKPAKPRPDFPLFPHAAGYWAKKIGGKLHYFGPWADPDGALTKYQEQKDDLHAGRKPRPDTDSLTVKHLANSFLGYKKSLVDNGELSPRSWDEYKAATDLLVEQFGKQRLVANLGPDDFAKLRETLAKRWGPVRLGNVIQRIRSVLKYALDNDLVDRPVRYGQGFKAPSKKTIRLHKAKQGAKLFTADEIRRLLKVANRPMQAMILLGINCGFGNADCGILPRTAVDLANGKVDYPRPKTGIARRCTLWPETVEALRAELARRPEPKNQEDADLVFVTKRGHRWAKDTRDNPVSKEFAKLLRELHINGRKGLGFYTLRHTFRTVADESKDQPAVDFIMGHEVPHMSSVYRETISDDRLKAVTDLVRSWLFLTPKVETVKKDEEE
jgi:integrase